MSARTKLAVKTGANCCGANALGGMQVCARCNISASSCGGTSCAASTRRKLAKYTYFCGGKFL
jgi:hypothetical protein